MINQILVVEDEAITALDLRFQLEDAGYKVFVADNAEDAYSICSKEEIDLVVADINIKGDVNGIEMAEKLSYDDIKIIFLSANPNNVDINLKNQEDPIYIKKPINITDFITILHENFD
ncbi:MAG: hypothetical protein BZ135_00620 [Methanosphaera sp. rholeuAM6]|nr:MAG: hypothetical protein BZ135_00620 [Methanosphaera sp. rholeuAM6]